MRANKQPDENNILAPLEWYTGQRKVSELIPCDFNPQLAFELKRNEQKISDSEVNNWID